MASYETVWEVINQCPNNQMRDVFIDEVETDDTDAYMENKFKGKAVRFEKTVRPDGTIIYEIFASGMHERMSFTPF
ncbi:MAG: hypothetical protein Q4B59_02875 [Lachnospiraceae bacterium]|nr:hypothetical protein [Lachnospiraceae bacterium]